MTLRYQVPRDFLPLEGPPIRVVIESETSHVRMTGLALVDTGAGHASIYLSVAEMFGLSQAGVHRAGGATGGGTLPQFDAALSIPDLSVIRAGPIPGLPLKQSGFLWGAIVGRDVLSNFIVTINGRTGKIEFTAAELPGNGEATVD